MRSRGTAGGAVDGCAGRARALTADKRARTCSSPPSAPWPPTSAHAPGTRRGESSGGLTFVVVVGGGEGTLVDVVGQEAMQGVLEGGEGCLVVRMQDGALMFVQMLQETGGGGQGETAHTQSWG